MATFHAYYTIEIVDVNGDVATTRMPFQAVDAGTVAGLHTGATNFGAALLACSNGKGIKTSMTILYDEAQLIVGTTPPTNAEYSSVTDGARLQFSNNTGERSSLTIPAPLESDFGAASNVVDPTDANVAALIAFWQANAADPAGVHYNLYKGGIKVGRRARSRRSSLVP